MKKLLLAFLIAITLSACVRKNQSNPSIECHIGSLSFQTDQGEGEIPGMVCKGPISMFFLTADGQLIPL